MVAIFSGFSTMPHNHSSKNFLRQRALMGSTGSLSHNTRNAVNVNAAYGTPGSSHSALPRGSHDMASDTPSPTSSVTSPVNFHLGDQWVFATNYFKNLTYSARSTKFELITILHEDLDWALLNHSPACQWRMCSSDDIICVFSLFFSEKLTTFKRLQSGLLYLKRYSIADNTLMQLIYGRCKNQ